MDQRKAFLFFGFMVLVWSVFWQGALRVIALRNAQSPAARGLLVSL
jgi:hypothetical protein